MRIELGNIVILDFGKQSSKKDLDEEADYIYEELKKLREHNKGHTLKRIINGRR